VRQMVSCATALVLGLVLFVSSATGGAAQPAAHAAGQADGTTGWSGLIGIARTQFPSCSSNIECVWAAGTSFIVAGAAGPDTYRFTADLHARLQITENCPGGSGVTTGTGSGSATGSGTVKIQRADGKLTVSLVGYEQPVLFVNLVYGPCPYSSPWFGYQEYGDTPSFFAPAPNDQAVYWGSASSEEAEPTSWPGLPVTLSYRLTQLPDQDHDGVPDSCDPAPQDVKLPMLGTATSCQAGGGSGGNVSCAKHVTLVVDAARLFHEPPSEPCFRVVRTKKYSVVNTPYSTQNCQENPARQGLPTGTYWAWDEVTSVTQTSWLTECKAKVAAQAGKTPQGILFYGLENGSWRTTLDATGVRYNLLELYAGSHVFSGAAEKFWAKMYRGSYGAILAITAPEAESAIVSHFATICGLTPDGGAVGWWAGSGSERITQQSSLYKQLVKAMETCTG
jgi:hypothetical protein